MTDPKLSLALSKVMIAAAWADGEVQPEEIECLKAFVLDLPGMDPEQWRQLDVYISLPIEEDERRELLEDLKRLMRTEDDQQFVMRALEMVFMADGIVSQEESRTIEEIRSQLGI